MADAGGACGLRRLVGAFTLADLSASKGERPIPHEGPRIVEIDGDKSPRDSGDKSPHSQRDARRHLGLRRQSAAAKALWLGNRD